MVLHPDTDARGTTTFSVVPHSLEIRSPGGVISYVELDSPRPLIGRQADCQIRLNDPAVSRHHAELFCDPFGRWWIHDLGSRNGTRVNGLAVVERVIGPSDAVEIKPFALRLREDIAAAELTDQLTSQAAPLSDGDFESVTTRTETGPANVAALHLSKLMEFGRRLLDVEKPEQRLRLLCALCVSPEFRGRVAAPMRLPKDRPGEGPKLLCEPVSAPDCPHTVPFISRGLLRALKERNEPVLGSNAGRGDADVELTVSKEEMAASAVACPVRSDDRTLDFLYVIFPPKFGTSEWLALTAMAAEEYQKAELAWAARRQAESHAAIESELEQARQIQMRLIPKDLKVAGLDVAIGFEPCRWVGGDYVDVLPVPDGRVLLTVADVCGKGLQAAMVAASLHSMVHVGMDLGLDLCTLMQHLNKHLCGYLPEHSFVTMIAVLIDPATGKMEAVNGGHPPGLLVDRRGGLRWLRAAQNLPLGISPADFECEQTRVDPDEMLALFTDGLTDSSRHRCEKSGLAPLGQRLRTLYAAEGLQHAQDVATRLSLIYREEEGEELLTDDRSFLLARRV